LGQDLVFGYRNRKKANDLEQRSGRRLKVVDEKNLYLRLRPEEETPAAMYALLAKVLAPPK
jgi:transcription-repair coupling factor (superfamily II helicase)